MHLRLFFFFLFITEVVFAQDYTVIKIKSDGLSQNMIQAVLQDSEGFMWFGTVDGLNRYDGHEFVVYQHDSYDSTTLIHNRINTLLEDHEKRIWVGTSSGLSVYHRKQDIFIQMPVGNKTLEESKDEIKDLKTDSFGNVWAITHFNKLIQYQVQEKEDSLEVISKLFDLPIYRNNTSYTYPFKIVNDKNQRLLIVSHSLIWNVDQLEDTIHQITPYYATKNKEEQFYNFIVKDRDEMLWFRHPSGHMVSQNGDSILPQLKFRVANYSKTSYKDLDYRTGLVDRNGWMWLGGFKSAVTCTNILSEESQYVVQSLRNNEFIESFEKSEFNVGSVMIYEDLQENIWVGTTGHGIYKFTPNYPLFNDKKKSKKIAKRSVSKLFKSKDGLIWFNTHFLNNYDPFANQINKVKSAKSLNGYDIKLDNYFKSISAIVEDTNNFFWILEEDGLLKAKRNYAKIESYEYYPIKIEQRKGIYNACFDLLDDGNFLWIVSRYDLLRFNKLNKEIKAYNFEDPFAERNNNSIVSATPCLFKKGDSIIWIGTEHGLFSFTKKDFTFQHHIGDDLKKNSFQVRSIETDPNYPDSIFWIATASDGLIRYTIANENFEYFTKENGLIDNVLYGVLSDTLGNLWISSNNGLMKFNATSYEIKSYYDSDGLQNNEFNRNSFHKAYDGELFFGGLNGFNKFYPKDIIDIQDKVTTVLTSYKINNKLVNFNSNKTTSQTLINEKESLIVKAEDRVLTFQFAALDYVNPDRNEYAYLLENFDEDWQYIGKKREVTFTNLNPGEYTLLLKATNSSGVWSDKVKSIKLIVVPPWYRSNMAIIFYILAIVALIYFFYRYQLNIQLKRAEANRLTELDKVKTKFFINISHEFRTPLTLIKGVIDRIRKTDISKQSDKLKSDFEVLDRNSNQLLNLVNQLLDIAKLESGSMRLNAKELDIYKYVKTVFFSYQSMAEKKNIKYTFKSNLTSATANADPKALDHIFQNLISNAIKFTNQGEIMLTVEHSDNDKIEISIIDSGIGLVKEDIQKIFNRFYQVDDTFSKEYQGTGIGLSLVKELVDLSEGEITVESELGVGSKFTVRLPVKEVNVDSETSTYQNENNTVLKESISPQTNLFKEEHESKPKLLIVEDNDDMRAYISSLLDEDYQLQLAANGLEGLKAAQETVPDFIVSDWMMPKMTGIEMIQELKNNKITSHIPCMLLTARADQESKLSGYKFGAEAYLIKPFNAEELLLQIKSLIDARKALQRYFSGESEPSAIQNIEVENQFVSFSKELVKSKIADPDLNGEWLASENHLSRSQYSRKLKALTNYSITQFINKERLQLAEKLLTQGELNISEIAYETGFSDPAYFSRVFSKEYGIPPKDYK